jgi:protein-tyrosine phosphatase
LAIDNYYRSRFAEELFNHEAERVGLDWRAQSRGLALERGVFNIGPISPFALDALREIAVAPRSADRFPQRCTANDLVGADFVVAVKEAEHRLLSERGSRNGSTFPNIGTLMMLRMPRRLKP